MRVLAGGHCLAFVLRCVHQFLRQAKVHRTTTLRANRVDDPTEGQALLTTTVQLHRNLIVGSADALGTNFNHWAHVVARLLEELDRRLRQVLVLVLVESGLDLIERVVNNARGWTLLAAVHHAVDELGNNLVLIAGVRLELRFASGELPGHISRLLLAKPAKAGGFMPRGTKVPEVSAELLADT